MAGDGACAEMSWSLAPLHLVQHKKVYVFQGEATEIRREQLEVEGVWAFVRVCLVCLWWFQRTGVYAFLACVRAQGFLGNSLHIAACLCVTCCD